MIAFFGISHGLSQNEKEVRATIIEEQSEVYQLDRSQLNELEGEVSFTFRPINELDTARAEVEAGDMDQVLVVQETNGVPFITHIYEENRHLDMVSMVSHLLQQMYLEQVLIEDEISPAVAERLLMPIEVLDEPIRSPEAMMQSFLVYYVFGFALYMLIITFGQAIATGVVSEKSSRVMEVMISKVKPIWMMFAKVLAVLGNAIVIVLIGCCGVLVAFLLGWLDLSRISIFGAGVDLSVVGTEVVMAAIIFFILGYFLYGMMFAAVGAMCSKMETLQTMSMPITILVMIPFFMGMFASDTSLLMQISSYIPFFTPFVMFNRLIANETHLIELVISMVLMVISIIIVGFFAARIYVNGVMYYSEKTSFKDIKRLLKR